MIPVVNARWGRYLRKGLAALLDEADAVRVPPRAAPIDKPVPERGLTTLAEEPTPLPRPVPEIVNEIAGENFDNLEAFRKMYKDRNEIPKSQRQSQVQSVKEAAEKLGTGEIEGKEFRNIVKRDLPIRPIENMVEMAKTEDLIGGLEESQVKKGIINLNKFIEDGVRIATRLDIPAYNRFNKWIVSLHDGRKTGGAPVGYGKTAVLDNVEFKSASKGAFNIASEKITPKGKKTSKSTIARMYGDWRNVPNEETATRANRILNGRVGKTNKYIDEEDGSEWIQVGMNPYRASFFYDKITGTPLKAAEEVIQVGPLVFARGSKRLRPSDFKTDKSLTITTEKGKKVPFKKGGSIMERNPYGYSPKAI
jgi:hypothetical protein